MVAPIRDLANTLNPAASKETTINPMVQDNSNMDMDINTPRERSASSSTNSSRSVHSNLSSIPYHERMEIQSKKLTWDKQVEINVRECVFLSIIHYSQGRREQTG